MAEIKKVNVKKPDQGNVNIYYTSGGGGGATSADFVDLTTDQNVGGAKNFTSPLTVTNADFTVKQETSANVRIIAENSLGKCAVNVGGAGDHGIWDYTHAKWDLVCFKSDGHMELQGGKLKIDTAGNVTATGDVLAYSDERLKQNIITLNNRGAVRPVEFDRDGRHQIGFIAQEMKQIYPELVQEVDGYFVVNYPAYTAVLQSQIDELKKEIEQLKNDKNNQHDKNQ